MNTKNDQPQKTNPMLNDLPISAQNEIKHLLRINDFRSAKIRYDMEVQKFLKSFQKEKVAKNTN